MHGGYDWAWASRELYFVSFDTTRAVYWARVTYSRTATAAKSTSRRYSVNFAQYMTHVVIVGPTQHTRASRRTFSLFNFYVIILSLFYANVLFYFAIPSDFPSRAFAPGTSRGLLVDLWGSIRRDQLAPISFLLLFDYRYCVNRTTVSTVKLASGCKPGAEGKIVTIGAQRGAWSSKVKQSQARRGRISYVIFLYFRISW